MLVLSLVLKELFCMIGTPYKRAAGNLGKADFKSGFSPVVKFFRRNITLNLQVLFCGLEILAQRQDLATSFEKIFKSSADFSRYFTKTEHES